MPPRSKALYAERDPPPDANSDAVGHLAPAVQGRLRAADHVPAAPLNTPHRCWQHIRARPDRVTASKRELNVISGSYDPPLRPNWTPLLTAACAPEDGVPASPARSCSPARSARLLKAAPETTLRPAGDPGEPRRTTNPKPRQVGDVGRRLAPPPAIRGGHHCAASRRRYRCVERLRLEHALNPGAASDP